MNFKEVLPCVPEEPEELRIQRLAALSLVEIFGMLQPSASAIVARLGVSHMPEDIATLAARLNDPDPARRAEAAEQLAHLGPDARPAAVALTKAAGDDSEEVREWAVAALEELGPPLPSDLGELAALLQDDSPDGSNADRTP